MPAIRPSDIPRAKAESIPEEVIAIFNEMIVENISANRAVIYQDDVIERIIQNMGVERYDIFDRNWLDVEPIFRAAGWNVVYDKPAYCENYKAHFIFSVKVMS